MERCLSIYVLAINVNFVVCEESDDVVDVAVDDGSEQDVTAHLFYPTYHFQINNY